MKVITNLLMIQPSYPPNLYINMPCKAPLHEKFA